MLRCQHSCHHATYFCFFDRSPTKHAHSTLRSHMDVPARSEGSPSQGAILCLQTLQLCRGIRGARRRPNQIRCTMERLGHCDSQGKTTRAQTRRVPHDCWCLLAEPPATTSFAGANKPCLETRISSTQLKNLRVQISIAWKYRFRTKNTSKQKDLVAHIIMAWK